MISAKFKNDVVQTISYVPGLAGLSSIDFSKKPTALKESDWIKGISFEETDKGFEVKLAIIIYKDTKSKVLVQELISSIKVFFKKTNIKIDRIIVYIRGVK